MRDERGDGVCGGLVGGGHRDQHAEFAGQEGLGFRTREDGAAAVEPVVDVDGGRVHFAVEHVEDLGVEVLLGERQEFGQGVDDDAGRGRRR
ncbi:hypothetical protein GTY65_10195 [Streptomyces sp. SID8379]|uniref:hypothetical protein n=1 Tax=unclassified Streptomyces TaxID=2593676 RepID=UPI001319EAEF|nr:MULTISPECIES: hypothetical protein [unclassified Streptomyces]MYW64438.1 hypothetical protein [Streptomyces sp. SID8379]